MTGVLVLDVSWQPQSRTSWERAITLIFEGKTEAVAFYEDRTVHSATNEWKVPSVIRWLKSTVRRKRSMRFSRDNIFIRDRGECQYCGAQVTRHSDSDQSFTFDHVLPRSKGGKTDWTNVVTSCVSCNQRKGSRLPQQAGMKLRRLPEKPKMLSAFSSYMVRWDNSMPEAWKVFLRSELYWHDTLDKG